MAANTIAGSALYISSTLPATEDEAGYEALTWVKIGEITNFGTRGDEYADVNHSPLDKRRVIHLKGIKDSGVTTYAMAWDKDDAGQVICQTAKDSDDAYAFKEEWQGGDGEYFSGLVMGMPHQGGDNNTIQANNLNIVQNTDSVPFDAP